jgi:hypothetical protein
MVNKKKTHHQTNKMLYEECEFFFRLLSIIKYEK